MSNNFFAALDDDDEPPKVVAPKVESKPTQVAPKKEHRRPNNNDRNTKHGRGGRAPPRDGKRAYERRSGTGRGKETKKDGGGSRNWGSHKNEARTNQGTVVEGEEGEKLNDEPEKRTQDVEEEPVVEEDKTLSLEEYMMQKALPDSAAFKPKEAPKFENVFVNVAPKTAVEEDFLVMGEGKKERVRDSKKEKQAVLTGFRVAPSDAGQDGDGHGRTDSRGGSGRGERGNRRDGRGGRGGGRRDGGRGGRGSGRDGRGRGRGRGTSGGRSDQVNVMDSNAFPSL